MGTQSTWAPQPQPPPPPPQPQQQQQQPQLKRRPQQRRVPPQQWQGELSPSPRSRLGCLQARVVPGKPIGLRIETKYSGKQSHKCPSSCSASSYIFLFLNSRCSS